MDLNSITPLILAYNEQANIERALNGLAWAKQILIIDSYSSDKTVDIASAYRNVRIVQRRFDDHKSQWNFGLAQIETEWVLTLDADYRCPPALADEIRSLDGDYDAYVASFVYCVDGKPLRSTLYPPRAVLFRPQCCHYVQNGHTQVLVHDERRTGRLRTILLHDDRKPLSHWLAAQAKYEVLEAQRLLETPFAQLGWKDRLRRWHVFMPLITFFYCLFVKRLILDGRTGLYYSLQRVYVELLISLTLLDQKLRGTSGKNRESVRKRTSSIRLPESAEIYELSHPGN